MKTNPAKNDKLKERIDAIFAEGGALAVIATLTGKQLLFVEEYVKDFNAVRASAAAGYNYSTEDNARKAAFNMLRHPAIKVAVQHYMALRAEKTTVDVEWIESKILQTITKAEDTGEGKKPEFNAILRGLELLARYKGMLKDKVEHTGADGGPIQHEEIKNEADRFTNLIDNMAKRHQQETIQ
jgi:phage terminase small subunit